MPSPRHVYQEAPQYAIRATKNLAHQHTPCKSNVYVVVDLDLLQSFHNVYQYQIKCIASLKLIVLIIKHQVGKEDESKDWSIM